MVIPLLAILAIGVAAAVMDGYLVLLVLIAVYIIHIPFAVRTKAWLRAHPEVWDDKPKQQRQARRAIRRAQPHRSSTARLRLRRPGSADERGVQDTTTDPAPEHLQLTARLNTSAWNARRGVVMLHPEAIAALGIREWDAVSLTGTRTTAAVVGVATAGTPRPWHCSMT